MKIEGYEEISSKEYRNLSDKEGMYLRDCYTNKTLYFKKVQGLPIVFEDDCYKISVNKSGMIIFEKSELTGVLFNNIGSFPLLVKAVEKAQEIIKKND